MWVLQHLALAQRFVARCRRNGVRCAIAEETSKRWQLHSTLLSHALQTFIEACSQCGLERVVPWGYQGVNGLFLGCGGFSQLLLDVLLQGVKDLWENAVAQTLSTSYWKRHENISSLKEVDNSFPLFNMESGISFTALFTALSSFMLTANI